MDFYKMWQAHYLYVSLYCFTYYRVIWAAYSHFLL